MGSSHQSLGRSWLYFMVIKKLVKSCTSFSERSNGGITVPRAPYSVSSCRESSSAFLICFSISRRGSRLEMPSNLRANLPPMLPMEWHAKQPLLDRSSRPCLTDLASCSALSLPCLKVAASDGCSTPCFFSACPMTRKPRFGSGNVSKYFATSLASGADIRKCGINSDCPYICENFSSSEGSLVIRAKMKLSERLAPIPSRGGARHPPLLPVV